MFLERGYAAARTRDIADEAGVNKGLLAYYSYNKEELFRKVFAETFSDFSRSIGKVFDSDMPLMEKIDAFVDNYMDFLLSNPHIPAFVIHELNHNRENFLNDLVKKQESPNPLKLIGQIQMQVEAGNIRRVNPFQFVLSMVSICVFPFLGRPLFQRIAGITDETYMEMMRFRKEEIKGLLKAGLRKPST